MKRTGFLMIKLKKFKKAENVYEELSKSDPKNEILFYRLACAKIELKQIGTAKEILFQTMKNSKVSGNLKVEALSRQELIKISILENQENYKIAQKLY